MLNKDEILNYYYELCLSSKKALSRDQYRSLHPRFSSSLIGAVLLGITTSLPEVVSYYTLIVIKNYDLALSNIIGSNFFNLFVLSIGDLVLDGNIYNFTDSKSYILILLVTFFTIISLLQNIKSSNRYNFLYFIPSLIIVTLYLLFWGVNFIH